MHVSFVITFKKQTNKQKLILWSVEQRRGSVFEPKRMIAICSCLSFGNVYITFPLLSIGALIHIFCLSLIHALMDETAIISMHACFQPLQHWRKKNMYSFSCLLLSGRIYCILHVTTISQLSFFMSLMVKKIYIYISLFPSNVLLSHSSREIWALYIKTIYNKIILSEQLAVHEF